MDDTIRRLARVLGAQGLEGVGADARFSVDGADGASLKVSIEGAQQRLMAVLHDSRGISRVTVDVAPVGAVKEDPAFPGRVVVEVASQRIIIDSAPVLAIEVKTKDGVD